MPACESSGCALAQPVLSRFIKRMEDDLQVQLLYRNGRGVSLTEAGDRLLQHASLILRNLSQAQTEVMALRGQPLGTVTVALPPMLGSVSAELVRRMRSEYPLVSISLREGFAAETLDWLSSGMSAYFHAACSPVINVNSGFVGSDRTALHVIDEGSQLRRHLMAAGIVEEYTRRDWRERLQDVYEFSRLCRSGSDRCRHLRQTHAFDGGT